MSDPLDEDTGLDEFDPVVLEHLEKERQKVIDSLDADTKGYLDDRRRAYQIVFNNPEYQAEIQFVLNDLAKFCRAFVTPYHPDQRRQDMLLGRNEVFIRILDHVALDRNTMYAKYTNKQHLG